MFSTKNPPMLTKPWTRRRNSSTKQGARPLGDDILAILYLFGAFSREWVSFFLNGEVQDTTLPPVGFVLPVAEMA
jgi:hypothetical protein